MNPPGIWACIIALGVVGCSSSPRSDDTTNAASAAPSSAAAPAGTAADSAATTASATGMVLKTANIAGIGDYLTDANGRAVYMFEKDGKNTSACSGDCAKSWPPLIGGTPTAGAAGVNGAMLGSIQRADGGSQVTYNGMPLYYYEDDAKPGDIKGQDKEEFGAEWYLVSPSGNKAEGKAKDE